MNDRINTLLKQAQVESSQYLGCKSGIAITHDALEKFAELIIEECLNTVGHYADVDEGIAVAKRNFGVE